jgi:hypothetical protein
MLAGSGAPPPEENPTERKYNFLLQPTITWPSLLAAYLRQYTFPGLTNPETCIRLLTVNRESGRHNPEYRLTLAICLSPQADSDRGARSRRSVLLGVRVHPTRPDAI